MSSLPNSDIYNPALRICNLEKCNHEEIFGFKFYERNGLIIEIFKDTLAEQAGLKVGECIIEINGLRVSKDQNDDKILSEMKGKVVELLILDPNLIEGQKFVHFVID